MQGLWTAKVTDDVSGRHMEYAAKEGESPVHEGEVGAAVSGVPRDTWNLVGRKGDHPLRLNTP